MKMGFDALKDTSFNRRWVFKYVTYGGVRMITV